MWQKDRQVDISDSAPDSYVIFTCCDLLQKHCWSVWEFDNMRLNSGLIVVYWTLRGIWRIITFNVILTITNAIGKTLPSSDNNGFKISDPTSYVMTYSVPLVLLLFLGNLTVASGFLT
jgi:hypothetical protein